MVDERRALPSGNGHQPAPEFVDRAGRALGWLYRSGWQVARRLPGGELAERQVQKVEAAFASEVRKHLEEEPPEPTALIEAPKRAKEPMRLAMAELLERSVIESKDAARDHYFESVLRQLLPDEARIVSALSDGTVFPLIHLAARTSVAGGQRLVLENASTVGRTAGVIQPGLVPLYVSRILRFGLAEVGEEDSSLGVAYEMLLTDDRVRDAETRIKAGGRFGPRIIRLTLRISELGAQFWAVCDPSARAVAPGERP
ncbi:Abi-alpha family protein [Actinokineospora sp. HUAS TT18]|uniref:Abi-alpha family protein n=1 Tax=Actinokineospora sp. HUAS TT18 TaxID=3447451 RepID=UPI003F527AF4